VRGVSRSVSPSFPDAAPTALPPMVIDRLANEPNP